MAVKKNKTKRLIEKFFIIFVFLWLSILSGVPKDMALIYQLQGQMVNCVSVSATAQKIGFKFQGPLTIQITNAGRATLFIDVKVCI